MLRIYKSVDPVICNWWTSRQLVQLDYQAEKFCSRGIVMKLPENIIAAIFAVYLIAAVCTILVIGGLYMTVSDNQYSHNDLTACIED